MPSVRSARRVRLLAGLVTVFAVVGGLAGIAAGVAVAVYRRIYVGPTGADGSAGATSTTFPYVWQGVGIAVGSLVVATVLLLLVESARMRAHVVLEDADGGRGQRRSRGTGADAIETDDLEVRPPRPPAPPNGRRVLVLSEQQKARLARIPPPQLDPGWYPDPLDGGSLRRWNGTQWTGEQQAIALPPR